LRILGSCTRGFGFVRRGVGAPSPRRKARPLATEIA
jgi:hypothetical protein